jgi:N-acetylmuramoyl-L-alanine amidase
MRNIKYIAIHCAATKPSMTVDIERVRGWHLKRGFSDVGYHFYIRQDGRIELGRPIEKTGAHVKGFNSVSIGICYEGGVDEQMRATDTRTVKQIDTMYILLKVLGSLYPKAKIQGHKDFPGVNKACPSFDVKEWCETNNINHNR